MRVRQFLRFSRSSDGDLRHAERTAALLRARGADEDLVLAGFLHDVAKPAETRIWHRIAAALLPAGARRRLARGDGVFARYLDHARLGAEEARRRGASERVVSLIARHHETPVTGEERMLHEADREALP
ncbi:MAG TPA: HD domain-containing protein [Candidatus Limnocylindria bacterium]|nr:HD domain-containing protein [Candidatus Limnocylindria bacterium]